MVIFDLFKENESNYSNYHYYTPNLPLNLS